MLELDCLRLSEDQRAAVISIHKPDHLVSESEIRALVFRSDFSEFEMDAEAITEATQQFAIAYASETSSDTQITIAHKKDAEILISISEDKMTATATIIAAAGGEHIGQLQLIESLREVSLSFGLQTQKALKFLAKTHQAEPGSESSEVIAHGRAPEHGVNSRFKRLVQTSKERILRPQKLDDGRVDMRNLGQLTSVKPGTPIMQRIPHVVGLAGKNVLGEEIPIVEGKELPFTIGEGTEIDKQNPDMLIASIVGLPIEIEQGMRVDEVFSVPSVDISSGHVDFSGSVIIKGDVQSGMKVNARGDIHVGGFVESSTLKAGGDILVQQSVIGQRNKNNEYNCKLIAQGSIHATNAQYAYLEAQGEVTVTAQLNHCSVQSAGKVTIADPNGMRGIVIGGTIQAGDAITTVVVGSKGNAPVYLRITGEYDTLHEKNLRISAEQEDCRKKISEVLDAQLKLDQINNEEKRRELQSRLDKTLNYYRIELVKLSQAFDVNEQKLNEFKSKSKLIVKKTMFANIHLEIAGKTIVSNREYGPTQSALQDYTLSFEPLNPT